MAKSYLSYKKNAKKLFLITHFKTFLKALKNIRRRFDVPNASFDIVFLKVMSQPRS